MSKAASTLALELLHAKVAEVITKGLEGSVDPVTGVVEPPSPQLIAQAIKYLKDNGIEAAKGSNNKALNDLADKVSKLDPDDPDAVEALYN